MASSVPGRNSEAASVYSPRGPGEKVMDYDKETGPAVAPPEQAPLIGPAILGGVDPEAVRVLSLIQGAKFKRPFTVTLMRREGMHVFKTDAGSKTEASFAIHEETIREPSDLLRINAAISSGAFKTLNNNTVEFQLLLYLAAEGGILSQS